MSDRERERERERIFRALSQSKLFQMFTYLTQNLSLARSLGKRAMRVEWNSRGIIFLYDKARKMIYLM